jgi:outer membrane receptor for ferrienterochelin and colicin
MPLDIWLPSSKNIKPRTADMAALGYFRNFRHNTLEASIEAYYKIVNNEIDFKDHAQLLLNQKIEGELRFGKAKSYGVEFMLRKQEGKLTGWLSYTWARAFRKINEINDGLEYPASYDKPHNVSVVLSYNITKRINLSVNWIYASGAAATFPTGRYEYNNVIVPVYSERNTYRMPDYHRLDVGATLQLGKNKPEKKFFSELNVSVYNVYNRKNAWMISFEPDQNDPNTIQAYKYYLFPILPSVTYNFHF